MGSDRPQRARLPEQVVEQDRASAAQRTITMGPVPLAALRGGLLADVFGMGMPLVVWPLLTLGAAALFFLLTARRSMVPTPV